MKNLIPKRVMEYIIITFAVVLMDVGIYVFKFPNNFSFGGVSGMAVVFSHFIPMTSAQINLVINLILLVIGFIVLGRDFGGFSNGEGSDREYYAGALFCDYSAGTGCGVVVF